MHYYLGLDSYYKHGEHFEHIVGEDDIVGYELKKAIQHQMGAWTDIKFGSIYHALNNLEKEGHVVKVSTSSEGGKPKRS